MYYMALLFFRSGLLDLHGIICNFGGMRGETRKGAGRMTVAEQACDS